MERLNITFVRVCVDRVLCVSSLVYKTNRQAVNNNSSSVNVYSTIANVRVHSVHAMNIDSAVSTNP